MDFFNHYYKSQINEGGNVRLRKDFDMGGNVVVGNDITADKIPLDKISTKEYDKLKNEIINTLKSFGKAFAVEYKQTLFPNFEDNIESGDLFSGSTRLFFTKSHDDLRKYKKFIGDIDLQYPEELRDSLKEFLADNEGKKYGSMIFVGSGGRSPTQENTIFKISNFPVENIQIDFEPTYFKDGKPTDFAKFAHSSDWEDIKVNVKGAFSKLLIRALVSNKEKLGDIAVMTSTGKISKSVKYKDPSMRKFSVDKGVRAAFEPVLDAKGNIQKTPEGKPIYRELDTKKSVYSRDLDDIFAFVFEKIPNPQEKELFHSFVGLLKLMNKYLDKDKIKKVFDSFLKIIWEKGQEIGVSDEFDEDGIQVEDFQTKKAAYDQFVKVFPNLKMSDKELLEYVKPFYVDLKRKKGLKK